jgi:subfamily B ATP-binding cassette protein MsbA
MHLPSEFKRIISELFSHKRRLVIVAIAGAAMAAADTTSANLIKYVFDGLQFGKVDQIKETFTFIIGLAFIKGIFRYVHFYNINYASELVAQSLRQQLQRKFMRLNLAFHNNFASGSGGLISRILYDITIIQNGLRMFADFFREPLLFIGLMATLFYLNYKLTFAILIVLPLVLWFLRQISRSIKKYSVKGLEDLEAITSTIKESLDGVRIIQSFNLENEMAGRFHKESDTFLYSRKRIHALVESSGPVTEFVMTLIIFSIMLYMAIDISKGNSTFGDFMSYVACLLMLSAPVKKLQESYVRVQETGVAAKRVFELLDETSEVPETKTPKPFPKDWKTIHFQNVSFRYGEAWVLKNLELTIHRGSLVAFVGPSGCGKSTLLNLLERFFDPTDGEILIDGTPIRDFSLRDLRHNIALVSQDVFLFGESIEHNIHAGDFSKDKERISLAAKKANAHQFISDSHSGYTKRIGDRGGLLSGGEKQRVSIARAFFKDAPILILDEATSALDSENEREVQKGLDELMTGRTALVVAHRLSTVVRADQIYVMKAGKIIEHGTHKELIAKHGEYQRLYSLQNQTESQTV